MFEFLLDKEISCFNVNKRIALFCGREKPNRVKKNDLSPKRYGIQKNRFLLACIGIGVYVYLTRHIDSNECMILLQNKNEGRC